MADFVTLTCPSCGGQLQITNDIDRFACGHCGTEHLVKRGGGIVALAPVVEGIKKVQSGVDKTAAELAIARLEREINQINKQIEAIDSRYDGIDLMQTAGGAGVVIGLFAGGFSGSFGVMFAVGFGVFILIIAVYFGLDMKAASEIAPLKQEVEQKSQEIAKQRRIVSG